MDSAISEEAVKSYLFGNPDFTAEYFAEHATSVMIQMWFQRRSKSNQIGGNLRAETKFSLHVQQEVSEDEGNDESTESIKEEVDPNSQRRNSEPITTTESSKKTAFELRGMRRKKAFTQVRNRVAQNKTFDEREELVSLLHTSKTSLRKTQSAPTCKNIFNSLINSSIYLHTIPTNNNQYKIDLRSASEDAFLKELIQDIVQDLNLRTLCKKIIVNIGILTNSECASLHLIEKNDQRRVMRTCYKDFKFSEPHQNINNAQFDGKLHELHEDREVMNVVESGKSSIAMAQKQVLSLCFYSSS